MELLINVKQDKDLQHIIKKGKEHLLETFNKDLMTVDELLAFTLDFIKIIEDKNEEIETLKEQIDDIMNGGGN